MIGAKHDFLTVNRHEYEKRRKIETWLRSPFVFGELNRFSIVWLRWVIYTSRIVHILQPASQMYHLTCKTMWSAIGSHLFSLFCFFIYFTKTIFWNEILCLLFFEVNGKFRELDFISFIVVRLFGYVKRSD